MQETPLGKSRLNIMGVNFDPTTMPSRIDDAIRQFISENPSRFSEDYEALSCPFYTDSIIAVLHSRNTIPDRLPSLWIASATRIESVFHTEEKLKQANGAFGLKLTDSNVRHYAAFVSSIVAIKNGYDTSEVKDTASLAGALGSNIDEIISVRKSPGGWEIVAYLLRSEDYRVLRLQYGINHDGDITDAQMISCLDKSAPEKGYFL